MKFLCLGGNKVGKTSLIKRFLGHEYTEGYKRTKGAETYIRNCQVPIELVEEVEDDTSEIMRSMFDDQNSNNNTNQNNNNKPQTIIEEEQDDDEFENMNEIENDEIAPEWKFHGYGNDSIRSEGTFSDYNNNDENIKDGGNRNSNSKTDNNKIIVKTEMLLKVTLELVDTAFFLQEKDVAFESVSGVVLVCDVTKKASLDHMDQKLHQNKKKRKQKKNFFFCLCVFFLF